MTDVTIGMVTSAAGMDVWHRVCSHTPY